MATVTPLSVEDDGLSSLLNTIFRDAARVWPALPTSGVGLKAIIYSQLSL